MKTGRGGILPISDTFISGQTAFISMFVWEMWRTSGNASWSLWGHWKTGRKNLFPFLTDTGRALSSYPIYKSYRINLCHCEASHKTDKRLWLKIGNTYHGFQIGHGSRKDLAENQGAEPYLQGHWRNQICWWCNNETGCLNLKKVRIRWKISHPQLLTISPFS